jgi:hypothetical protein
MTPGRLALLLAGHTLAESAPLGPVLRALPIEGADEGAAAAEAGNLGQALTRLRFPKDLVGIAELWPAALRPATERLDRLPSSFLFQVPVAQTLAWFLYLLVHQILTLLVLRTRVLGALLPSLDGQAETLLMLILVFAVLFTLLLPPAIYLLFRSPLERMRLFSWGRCLARAREASLAAGLVESGAPAQVLTAFLLGCQELKGRPSRAGDLDAIAESAIASARSGHQRFLGLLRAVGYGVISLLAFGIVSSILLGVARLAVLP